MKLLMLNERLANFSQNTPDKTAIECGLEKISYYQLEEETNKIANFLIDNYTNEKNVFVMMENSINLIKTTLGIIKSGGIFVPVNHAWPDERLKSILDTISGAWIVTTNVLLKRVIDLLLKFNLNLNVLVLGNVEEEINCRNMNIYLIDNCLYKRDKIYNYCENEHCYIFFTSGSTGIPKAVLGKYKSLMQFIQWEIEEFNINESFKISQLTPCTVDAVMRDILVPLCSGGTLCIPKSRDIILDPIKLINWIEESKINLIHMVPSLFKSMERELNDMNQFKELKYILLAGELLRGKYIEKFIDIFGDRIQLVNLYGPTETTLVKMFYLIKSSDVEKSIIPVGKPMKQCQVYILNNNLKKCPLGVLGEVYIRTPYMTSGYLNDKELTAKTFIKNPFTENENDIIYKTGDLGRMLSDGNIEIIGRADNQVKIRGVRIELGEVENKLLQYKPVNEAVVIAKEDENYNKYLCAFLVGDSNLKVSEIRKYSQVSLPEAMMPSHFKIINRMPLNNTGKIDRKALALIDVSSELENEEIINPSNETERKLLELFSDTLGINNIGVTSNFFHMGGHSLKAGELISKIYKVFDIEVPIQEIYNKPTVRELSIYLLDKGLNTNSMLELLNEQLKNKFGQSSRLVKYNAKFYEVIVLYTNNFYKEILDYIKEYTNGRIMVDYICDYNSTNRCIEHEETSIDNLSLGLNLKTLSTNELKIMLDNQNEMMDKLCQDILLKEKIKEYKIGCVMESNCRHAHRDKIRNMMRFTIFFKNENFSNSIGNTLIKLINEQSVLRTSVSLSEDTYRFVEHDKINEINFCSIDLSQYDWKSQIEAVEKITYLLDKSMSNGEYLENILYNFSMVKLSLSQYCFILNIDHQISDVHTPRIIKKYLEEQFNETTEILPFNHYINNILLKNNEYKFNMFTKSHIYKDYLEASESFYKKYSEYDSDEPIILSKPFVLTYRIDSDNIGNYAENKSILGKVIYIVCKILSFQFKLDRIPIGIVSNKRIWNKHNYYYTIGNFVDKMPCTFNNEYKEESDYYNKYLSIETELAENEIVLRNLNDDMKFTEYVYKLSPISLNYLGDYTIIEDMHQMRKIGVMRTLKYSVKAYSINSSTLKIIFNHGLQDQTIEFAKKLLEELGGGYEYNFY